MIRNYFDGINCAKKKKKCSVSLHKNYRNDEIIY